MYCFFLYVYVLFFIYIVLYLYLFYYLDDYKYSRLKKIIFIYLFINILHITYITLI